MPLRNPVRANLLLIGLLFIGGASRADESRIAPGAKYAEAAEKLSGLIRAEVADKRLPSLSIALVDADGIAWAEGFGMADPRSKRPADAATVYRVGSVSKLYTDLAIMRLVEEGKLDLDVPVTRYLPDFHPRSAYKTPITLRQILSHRAGIVRESPVGHYFDPEYDSIAATVASLNDTDLIYEPGTRTKYSNAGITVLGRVIEVVTGKSFTESVDQLVLKPLGMTSSSFLPGPEIAARRAKALMWTYDGRDFPAPTWPLGILPAGNLESTVIDQGKFIKALFDGGDGAGGRVVKAETLKAMYLPQLVKKGETTGFGLGFLIDSFKGQRKAGHGGAVYGFATELAFLPDRKLGVVVATSRDCANAVTELIANNALNLMLAVQDGKPLPALDKVASKLPPGLAKEWRGRYGVDGQGRVDLSEFDGRLFLTPVGGGAMVELRNDGDAFVVDDPIQIGQRYRRDGRDLLRGETRLVRQPDVTAIPAAPSSSWMGLIGEYGWDHNTLYILEREGKLHALIEWFFLYPLKELGPDEFAFPDFGLYHGEKLKFTRDSTGRATKVNAASVEFGRRKIDGEGGVTFRIKPLKPVSELRPVALAAKPPVEKGDFRTPELVELITLDPTIQLDIRYATDNNFMGTPLYSSAKAFLQKPAAEALLKAHKALKPKGYGLLIHDGYRPWSVTKMFWDATPPPSRIFVANPAKGSKHNRGCAIDLSMYDLATGKPVEMVGGYDEFSPRSFPDYPGGTGRQRWLRELLRDTMEAEGFSVNENEWWHFDYKDWSKYPIMNKPFE